MQILSTSLNLETAAFFEGSPPFRLTSFFQIGGHAGFVEIRDFITARWQDPKRPFRRLAEDHSLLLRCRRKVSELT